MFCSTTTLGSVLLQWWPLECYRGSTPSHFITSSTPLNGYENDLTMVINHLQGTGPDPPSTQLANGIFEGFYGIPWSWQHWDYFVIPGGDDPPSKPPNRTRLQSQPRFSKKEGFEVLTSRDMTRWRCETVREKLVGFCWSQGGFKLMESEEKGQLCLCRSCAVLGWDQKMGVLMVCLGFYYLPFNQDFFRVENEWLEDFH